MDLTDQLAMLNAAVEVEDFVRAVASRRSVTTVRRGDQITVSRAGADAAALTVYPAVVSIAVDPARARALDGAPWVDRVETKTATTSLVWASSTRLRTGADEAVTVALEAVDRRPRAGMPRAASTTRRTTSDGTTRRTTAARAAVPVAEPKICPRCGLQISAAGSCFCD